MAKYNEKRADGYEQVSVLSSDTNWRRLVPYWTVKDGRISISTILCAQKGKRLTRALLDTVVATSDKKRFSYSSDGRCIRAFRASDFAGRYFLAEKHRHSLPRYGKPFP